MVVEQTVNHVFLEEHKGWSRLWTTNKACIPVSTPSCQDTNILKTLATIKRTRDGT